MRMLKLVTLSMLTLAVGMAQDHPIIISSGSPLTLQHDSWDDSIDEHTLGTKVRNNKVTEVDVTIGGVDQKPPISPKGKPVEMHMTYGAIQLSVTTDDKGRNPVVKVDPQTSFKVHFRRKDANTFESLQSDASIQGLAISVGGVAQNIPAIPPGTPVKITIHYK